MESLIAKCGREGLEMLALESIVAGCPALEGERRSTISVQGLLTCRVELEICALG
jgi:hypothetical protein